MRIGLSTISASCLFWVLFLTTPLAAQQPAAAVLSGRVTDQTGAAMTGVKIVARSKATETRSETSTNDSGFYALSGLPAGEYEVRAQAANFAETIYESVVLQVGRTTALDITPRVKGVAEQLSIVEPATPLVNTTSGVIDGLISSSFIEGLPLNGRNYLELALLIPGNTPAPNFDPTKTGTVVISSAGQLGRGGNITIDGGDNNDDVVGGPLNNIPQDAVQEFQIATNQFSAGLGRSGSSVANVVTKSGSNAVHGAFSFFLRDDALQALPPTLDRSLGLDPSFDRQQYAASLGGPIVKDKAWWFGAVEFRNQDGAVLVGERNTATASITRGLAPAPLNDLIATVRSDWQASAQDLLTFRYSLQLEDDVSASTLARAIGSASQRQSSDNHFHVGAFAWTRVLSARTVNRFSFSENNFRNRITPVQPGPQLTFPSLQDGASFRVPQETRQNRLQFSDTISWAVGRHRLDAGAEFQKIDAAFFLEVFQQGRIELVQDFPDFDRNQDGRVNDDDLLIAVTLRSAFPTRPLDLPDADNKHFAFFIQDNFRVKPWLTLSMGLRYELDTDVKNVSRVDELNPLILPFLKGERHRDKNNFAPRVAFNISSEGGRFSLRGGYGIFYDRITLEIESLERGLDGRALPIEVRAGNTFFLDTTSGVFAPGAPTLSSPFTGFILPGAGAGGINIIDNSMQNPMVQHFTLGVQWSPTRDFVLRADGVH
ncbi:MAG TPA: carboxypeptidase-like regulatory domain-containing protein, partial [Terriglobia bacterium]|nr:carboxypeptidase-like regulatory domain-containing protein [Terriglobia bacterium]